MISKGKLQYLKYLFNPSVLVRGKDNTLFERSIIYIKGTAHYSYKRVFYGGLIEFKEIPLDKTM